jgi:hypothetical protein
MCNHLAPRTMPASWGLRVLISLLLTVVAYTAWQPLCGATKRKQFSDESPLMLMDVLHYFNFVHCLLLLSAT